ncbi:MAG: hypothetical protein P1V51_19790 [Deltaproteobacteria bacterium]|nr:hypothetical protein [Deltaproteobacteria bacterium]
MSGGWWLVRKDFPLPVVADVSEATETHVTVTEDLLRRGTGELYPVTYKTKRRTKTRAYYNNAREAWRHARDYKERQLAVYQSRLEQVEHELEELNRWKEENCE